MVLGLKGDETPLMKAVMANEQKVIEFLVENNLNDLLSKNKNGQTPMDLAYALKNEKALSYLRSRTLKLSKPKPKAESSDICSCQLGNESFCWFLLVFLMRKVCFSPSLMNSAFICWHFSSSALLFH